MPIYGLFEIKVNGFGEVHPSKIQACHTSYPSTNTCHVCDELWDFLRRLVWDSPNYRIN